MEPRSLRLLATDNNRRGDLFTRVVADAFHSLGFDISGVNVQRPGSEMDIEGRHRFEPNRFLLAECKATAKPIGGDAVNKFAGATETHLRRREREQEDAQIQLSRYFVSLSGFPPTARAQEEELGNSRMVLLDGVAVLQQLIDGKIVVPAVKAVDVAREQLRGARPLTLSNVELWVHGRGNFWAVAYRGEAAMKLVVLVHADGSVVASRIAADVFASARAMQLVENHQLVPSDRALHLDTGAVRHDYFRYLTTVCGEIQLDGLPANEQIGTRRLQLESLFVPMRLARVAAHDSQTEAPQVEPVGKVLSTTTRIAILAPPGAGKSTLIKRIAVAYADPNRKKRAEDNLPDRNWLPLLIRCRDLGTDARRPISVILNDIAQRGELSADLHESFEGLVSESLRAGSALLLVDGLDEISNHSDRMAFVINLRTFLGVYPTTAVIITSREAGFRVVAGALAAECQKFRIDDLDAHDIERLVEKWHRDVYGRSNEGDRVASDLARTIIGNDRIRRLAAVRVPAFDVSGIFGGRRNRKRTLPGPAGRRNAGRHSSPTRYRHCLEGDHRPHRSALWTARARDRRRSHEHLGDGERVSRCTMPD